MKFVTRGELRAPALVIDLDLDGRELPSAVDVREYTSAYCLVRRGGWPTALHFLDVADTDIVDIGELRDMVDTAPQLTPEPGTYDGAGIELTVAICTRDRQDGLRVTLQSLARQTDHDFEVIVVDNSTLGDLAASFAPIEGLPFRIIHEPVAGLSHARNRALDEVQTNHVAWIDDDERADPTWIHWVKQGFASPGRPGVVSGLMLPAELDTQAQVNFERYGGFNKGRGLGVARLRANTPSVPDTIYPLPNFGAGGNMAFRTELLRSVGGFERHLGAGTLTHGGEETLALSRSLDAGAVILHWPPSITWHYHRRTDEALEIQFYGYAAGLSAFYVSLLFASPVYALRILRLVPRGITEFLSRNSDNRNSDADSLPLDFPPRLLAASRRGFLAGAFLYLRERARQRRRGARMRGGEVS